MTVCCPCDVLDHPRNRTFAAGLSALPRQIGRAARNTGWPCCAIFPLFPPLSGWRAREGDDLGIMLLEMWAYVLDILGFYDERIANETYLRTAVLPPVAAQAGRADRIPAASGARRLGDSGSHCRRQAAGHAAAANGIPLGRIRRSAAAGVRDRD